MQPGDEVEWVDPDQVDHYLPDDSPTPPIWRPGLVVECGEPGYVAVDTGQGETCYVRPEYVRSAPRLPL